MKKLFFCSLVASTVLVSCCKEGVHPHYNYNSGNYNSHSVNIEATIASGAEYQLDLQPYAGADDVATIKTQAVNYTTSEIVRTGIRSSPVYHFSAVTNNKLPFSEKVVIEITGQNNGQCGQHHDGTLITIDLKVQ